MCEKSFAVYANLDNHIKVVHEGRRDHKCEICGKGFVGSRDLVRHVQSVHQNIKEYKCNHCTKEFAYQSSLKNHIKKYHKLMQENGENNEILNPLIEEPNIKEETDLIKTEQVENPIEVLENSKKYGWR